MEYLPAPQLPTGLAEETARMRQQNAMMIPQAVQSMIQQLGQQFMQQQAQQQTQQRQLIPTQQLQGLGILPPSQPQGWQGPQAQGQSFLPTNFPMAVKPEIAELAQKKFAADEATTRALGVGKLKADAADASKHLPVDDAIKSIYEKAGYKLPPGVSYVDRSEFGKISDELRAKEAAKATAGKQDVASEKLWEGLNRAVNPINAPRGSLLGQAGQGNARADRALTTLNDPKLTPQQVSAVVADYAGIMQGGSPHEIALRQMGYDNLATRWANLQQFINSKPQALKTPEVVGKLRQMISEIKQVDNQIIQNNLDTVEQTHSGLLLKDPERWQKVRESVMKTTGAKTHDPMGIGL